MTVWISSLFLSLSLGVHFFCALKSRYPLQPTDILLVYYLEHYVANINEDVSFLNKLSNEFTNTGAENINVMQMDMPCRSFNIIDIRSFMFLIPVKYNAFH